MHSCTSNTSRPNYEPLTVEQERLVTENTSLVYWVTIKYFQKNIRSEDMKDDLVSVGNIGLVKAARDYDASRGTTFSTIAVKYITNEILRYLRDYAASDIHVPYYMQKQLTNEEMNQYRFVRIEELLAKNESDTDDFLRAMSDEHAEFEGFVSLKADAEFLLNQMPARPQAIMIDCLTTDYTLRDIAKKHGVSMTRVQQIKKDFRAKMLGIKKCTWRIRRA